MRATRKQRALLKSLRTNKGRDETGLFLVEGVRACSELINAKVEIELVLVAEERQESLKILPANLCAKAANHEPLIAPLSEVENISDTVNSQGIVVAARWNDIKPDVFLPAKKAVIVAVDRVADPGNIGTIIRTAAWFGVTGVLLGDGCADLLNPKTVRATMGGIFQIPICRRVKLAEELPKLKMKGYRIAAATLGGSPEWRNWGAAEKSILALGSEAHGMSREVLAISDIQVTIPRRGVGESLNVAVSAGILLSALPENSGA